MVKGAVEQVWLPRAQSLVEAVATMSDLREVPLLAHTHGQPATPTTMGKEPGGADPPPAAALRRIEAAEYLGKLNGATGTFGAHLGRAGRGLAGDQPVVRRGSRPDVEPADDPDREPRLAGRALRRRRALQRVLHNLCTDVWTYISMGYFAQVRARHGQSSTMPHKVNLIRFENAEANLEVSNALLDVLGSTLVTSRLQRDLTDSSMQRNIGTAYCLLLALDNVLRGLAGLDAVPEAMAADLDANWEVLGEPVQSAMRPGARQGVPGMDNPYERLKDLTRGRRITGDDLREFVAGWACPTTSPSGCPR